MLKWVLMSIFISLHLLSLGEAKEYCEIIEPEEEIVVTATRIKERKRELPTNVTVVTEDTLRRYKAVTVADILDTLPGTRISSYGTVGALLSPRIRHSGASHVLILLDGRPLNGISLATSHRLDLTTIPINNIERIEVVRSANSASFGANALAGVINIITKRPKDRDLKFELSNEIRSFDTNILRVDMNRRLEKGGFVISADKYIAKGWRENSDYDRSSLSTRFEYDSANLGRSQLSINLLNSEVGTPGSNRTPIEEWDNKRERKASSPNARLNRNNSNAYLTHRFTLGDRPLELTVYGTDERLTWVNPDGWGLTDKHSENISKQLCFEVQYEPFTNLLTGISLHKESIDQKYNESPKDGFSDTGEGRGVFTQLKIPLGKRTTFSTGLRYDNHSMFGDALSPRVSLIHSRTNGRLSLVVSRGWRAPTFLDLYWPKTTWAEGNPNLVPEKGLTYDLGIELNRNGNYFTINAFRRNMEDLIKWAAGPDGIWRPSNIDAAKTEGIELITEVKTGEISHRFSFDSIHNTIKEKDAPEFVIAGYSPLYRLNYALSSTLPFGIDFTLDSRYTHEQYSGPDKKGKKLPPFTLVNTRVAKKMDNAEFYLGTENLFDTRYMLIADYPLPGRSFYGGVNFGF